jgi:hypothetical protein
MTNPQDVVQAYRNAGWNLPFPLPAGKKFPPPEGFTGVYGQYPDGHDVRIWIEQDRYHNYGIRAPEGVIGIDWDAYKGHPLYAWLTVYVDAAPRSTSKGGDQNAAIYWLRVDEDLVEQLRDRHFAEAGTEVIRKQHRYAVVWPSIHPDTGDRYEWYGPLAGADLDENYAEPLDYPPAIDDLPHIPRATVEAAIKQYGGGKRTSSGVSRRGAGDLERDDARRRRRDRRAVRPDVRARHRARRARPRQGPLLDVGRQPGSRGAFDHAARRRLDAAPPEAEELVDPYHERRQGWEAADARSGPSRRAART